VSAVYTRRATVIVVACALVGGAAALNHALVGVFYDDGLYAGIAYALSHGLGYVHPHLPGTPAVIHYPPVYPLVLAPLYGILSVSAAGFAAKVLNAAFAVLAAGLITWHAMRTNLLGEGASRWLAPLCVGATALAIPVLTVQSVLFAEPLFAVLLAVSVILADTVPSTASGRRGDLAAAMAGIATALALLTRTIAVAAGAGIFLFLLVGHRVPRRRALLAALPVAVAALGWGVWILAHRSGIDPALAINYGSYGEVVKQTGLSAFGSRAPDLMRPLGMITLGWLPIRALYYLFGLSALAIGVYGLWLLSRRSAIGFTLLGYLAILAVWPFTPDRFLWAVLPWLALTWVAGAVALYQRQRRARLALAILLGVMVVGYGQYQVRGVIGRWWGTQATAISENFRQLLPWLDSLPPGTVLATDDEALVWLYTRRVTVPFYVYGYEGSREVRPTPLAHRAYLERMGVTHILFSGFGGGSDVELNDLIGAFPRWLTPVHVWSGDRALFAVQPPPPRSETGSARGGPPESGDAIRVP
jgi:hypothetical protein